MNSTQPYYLLAAEAYGTGTYDCGNFDEGCTTTSTGTDTNTGTDTGAAAGGGLSYTGYNIIIPVAIGAALVIAAIILVVTRLTRRRKSSNAA